MDLIESSATNEMGNPTITFLFMTRKTIGRILDCGLSCGIAISFIYILIALFNILPNSLSTVSGKLDTLFVTIGFIGCLVFITSPFGFYGSKNANYWSLLIFIFLSSYHLYAYCFYLYFHSSRSSFQIKSSSDDRLEGGLMLHKVCIFTHMATIIFSMLMASSKIIVSTKNLDTASIYVQDNISSD